MTTDPTRLSAHEMARLLRAGETSAHALAVAHLDAAERDNHGLNAWLTIERDDALAAADAADARLADARRAGGAVLAATHPLLGVPIALKDLVSVAGWQCTAGSRILEGYIAPYDAHITERLRDVGAVILGKTNMDEFAMGSSNEFSGYGPVSNPWELAMAGAMCRAAGRATAVAGNIGVPVLDALAAIEDGGAAPDVFVLELSSFQLESTSSLAPDAATVLNVSEDHLDRYDGMTDYAAAKARVFAGNGVQVLNRDDRLSQGMARPGRSIRTFGFAAPRGESEWGIAAEGAGGALAHGARRLMAVSELPLAGLHNAANALAAHALAHAIGLPDEPLVAALREFRGLPHRMQKVAEIAGVAFYDDSKGTNVGATVAALCGLDRSAVLIAGGDGKGQDFSPLAPAVKGRARAVVLIGRDAALIEKALAGSGARLERAAGMEEAVAVAFAAARAGDAVLLSPACASYDMFRDYVARAEAFVAAVRGLEKRRG